MYMYMCMCMRHHAYAHACAHAQVVQPNGYPVRASVLSASDKRGAEGILVEIEGKHQRLPLDGLVFQVLEPPLHMVDCIRRGNDGEYEGILLSDHRRIYVLNSVDLEAHFAECKDSAWLGKLERGGSFKQGHVAPRGSHAFVARDEPDCVPGSLIKALAHAGANEAAALVAAHAKAIIAAANDTVDRHGDRVQYAAIDVLRALLKYEVNGKEVPACALAADPRFVTLVLLKAANNAIRTHGLCLYDNLIFDSAVQEPLALTLPNLTR